MGKLSPMIIPTPLGMKGCHHVAKKTEMWNLWTSKIQPVDKQINYIEGLLEELGPIGIHIGVKNLSCKAIGTTRGRPL